MAAPAVSSAVIRLRRAATRLVAILSQGAEAGVSSGAAWAQARSRKWALTSTGTMSSGVGTCCVYACTPVHGA